jgi:hypothetical protein
VSASVRRNAARAACAGIAIAFVLIGCRGVIGIEDLKLVDGGTTGTEGGADTGTDAFKPDGPPPGMDAGGDGSAPGCATQAECRKCCHENPALNGGATGPGFDKLSAAAVAASCICGAGKCQTECATASCANPTMPAGMPCGPCIDGLFIKNPTPPISTECMNAKAMCNLDPDCMKALACLSSCNN